MSIREGGSYTADAAGNETLVTRTEQPDPVAVAPSEPPDVVSAPAAPPVEDIEDAAQSARLRSASKPQE